MDYYGEDPILYIRPQEAVGVVGASPYKTRQWPFGVYGGKMRFRTVHTKIWQDEWFSSLSRASKLVFIYLITNRSIGMSGIYELPDRVICFDTGLNQSEIDPVKEELAPKVSFFKGWVFVKNSTRYNTFKGKKLEVAKNNEVSLVPLDVKKALVEGKDDRVSIPHRYPSDTSISSPININIRKGGVGGKKNTIDLSGLYALSEKDFEGIAKKYGYPIAFVRSKYDDLVGWVEERPNNPILKGRVWKRTLMNWVKRDGLKIKQDYAKTNNKRSVDLSGL